MTRKSSLIFLSLCIQIYFLQAQVLSSEIVKDTSLVYKRVYTGVEVSGLGYAFAGIASNKISSNSLFLFFATDYKGEILHKKTYPNPSFSIDTPYIYNEYYYYNIHYTNPGYVLTGLLSKQDTAKRIDSFFLCSMKLDDSLNMINTYFQYVNFNGSAFLYNGAHLKSRLLNNKILLCYTDIYSKSTSIIAKLDTSGKFLLVSKDTDSFSFDIVENTSGYIAALGLLSDRSFFYLDDSLKVIGKSAQWEMPGYPRTPGFVFNHSGLDANNGNTTIKRLSPVSLIHGGDCDSVGDPNAPGPLFTKSMYAFIKTDNAGNIILKKGFAPNGTSGFVLDQGIINTFDFINPNNIFLGVRAGGGFWIMNLDSNLNERWSKMVYPSYSQYVSASHSMFATSDGGCVVTGVVNNASNPQAASDVFIVKINSDGSITGIPDISIKQNIELKVYPNPFSDYFIVEKNDGQLGNKISVFDLTGRKILEQALSEKETTIFPPFDFGKMLFYKISEGNTLIKCGKLIRE